MVVWCFIVQLHITVNQIKNVFHFYHKTQSKVPFPSKFDSNGHFEPNRTQIGKM